MRAAPPLVATLLVLLAPACGGDPDGAECEGACDTASPAESALVDCWLEESETDDDFFRLDKLHCRYQPSFAPLDMSSIAMDVVMADGKRGSVLFDGDDAGMDTFVVGIQSGGFPLELNVQATLNFTDRNEDLIGIDGLRQTRQTIEVAGLEDASLESPLQISLPFDVMDLEFFNRHPGEARVEFGHNLAIGEEIIPVDKTHQILDFGRRSQVQVAVSRGADSIGTMVTLHDSVVQSPEVGRFETVLEGGGRYELSLDSARLMEEEEFVEPEGHLTAICRLLSNTQSDGSLAHSLHCFGNPVPSVDSSRKLRVVPAALEGEDAVPLEFDLPATGEVMVSLEAHQLPAQVEVHSVLDDTASGLGRLASRTHVARHAVSTESTDFNAHLPFRVWTVEMEVSDDFLFAALEPDERFLDLGFQWGQQFALHIRDDEDLSAQPSAPGTLVIAVPTNVESISGTLELVDQSGEVTTIAAEFSHGRWLASADGLSAVN